MASFAGSEPQASKVKCRQTKGNDESIRFSPNRTDSKDLNGAALLSELGHNPLAYEQRFGLASGRPGAPRAKRRQFGTRGFAIGLEF